MAHDLCPPTHAALLDSFVRRLLQNPRRILAPHVRPGYTVLDLGCGPGAFTWAIAELVGEGGTVIAADLQQEMLDMVGAKAERLGLSSRIRLHRTRPDSLGLTERFDFALAFYMVHEVPDKDRLFAELAGALKPEGLLLLVEPLFHVSGAEYEQTLLAARRAGLEPTGSQRVFMSRASLLRGA